jgi:hypothetical protein
MLFHLLSTVIYPKVSAENTVLSAKTQISLFMYDDYFFRNFFDPAGIQSKYSGLALMI